jgi:hypothetical protein
MTANDVSAKEHLLLFRLLFRLRFSLVTALTLAGIFTFSMTSLKISRYELALPYEISGSPSALARLTRKPMLIDPVLRNASERYMYNFFFMARVTLPIATYYSIPKKT